MFNRIPMRIEWSMVIPYTQLEVKNVGLTNFWKENTVVSNTIFYIFHFIFNIIYHFILSKYHLLATQTLLPSK